MLLKLVSKLCTWRVNETSMEGHLIRRRNSKQLAETRDGSHNRPINVSVSHHPAFCAVPIYTAAESKNRYTGVDLQGPINSAFTEPVITAGARTLGCPLRRVPSAGSFHQQSTTLLSSLQELSEERSYNESPYTVITICHFRSVVFPPASLIGPSGKAAVGSA
jgi:hypothetical protein